MRALVLAHGSGERWDVDGNPWRRTPKQLLEVDGETLLARQVRLLRERGVDDVVVVAPDGRFRVAGASRVSVDPYRTGCDMDKFFATQHLWAAEGRTTLLWGDCWYSDDAMDRIVGHRGRGVHYFRRPWASVVTGHPWDESFAVTWTDRDADVVLEAAEGVWEAWRSGVVRQTHIRTHYAWVLGRRGRLLDKVDLLVDTPGQSIIDDFTDDMDTPEDWRRWSARRAMVAA